MFMAEKLIITGEVKKQSNMAFKMNGSPAKLGIIKGTTGHSSALKQKKEIDRMEEMRKAEEKKEKRRKEIEKGMKNPFNPYDKKQSPVEKKSPTKQRGETGELKEFLISERGFTPEDADKMIADGAYTKKDIKPGIKRPVSKTDKPVTPKDGDYKKYSDLEKYDDDNPTGKMEPPKKEKN